MRLLLACAAAAVLACPAAARADALEPAGLNDVATVAASADGSTVVIGAFAGPDFVVWLSGDPRAAAGHRRRLRRARVQPHARRALCAGRRAPVRPGHRRRGQGEHLAGAQLPDRPRARREPVHGAGPPVVARRAGRPRRAGAPAPGIAAGPERLGRGRRHRPRRDRLRLVRDAAPPALARPAGHGPRGGHPARHRPAPVAGRHLRDGAARRRGGHARRPAHDRRVGRRAAGPPPAPAPRLGRVPVPGRPLRARRRPRPHPRLLPGGRPLRRRLRPRPAHGPPGARPAAAGLRRRARLGRGRRPLRHAGRLGGVDRRPGDGADGEGAARRRAAGLHARRRPGSSWAPGSGPRCRWTAARSRP